MTTVRLPARARPEFGDQGQTKTEASKPLSPLLILNDDYTPMEFVVHVLERFFDRTWKRRPRSCCTSTTTESANAAFLLRDRRNQGDAGHGPRPEETTPFAMRHGKEVALRRRSGFPGLRIDVSGASPRIAASQTNGLQELTTRVDEFRSLGLRNQDRDHMSEEDRCTASR